MRRHWLIGLGIVAPLVSCLEGETTQTPVDAAPAPGPSVVRAGTMGLGAPQVYRSDWRSVPEGRRPAEFQDVRRDGHGHSWLYDAGWRIAHGSGRAVFAAPFALREPREPLSFQRYVGGAFGPDGTLPERYRIEAEATSLGGSTRFGGYGELAIQAVYLSPTRYVEVLQTDRHLMLWEADEAPPMQGKGWKRLAQVPHPARVGQWLRFGAEVDRRTGEIKALLDGRVVASATSGLIGGDPDTRFTIRATGNREEWRWIEARELH